MASKLSSDWAIAMASICCKTCVLRSDGAYVRVVHVCTTRTLVMKAGVKLAPIMNSSSNSSLMRAVIAKRNCFCTRINSAFWRSAHNGSWEFSQEVGFELNVWHHL